MSFQVSVFSFQDRREQRNAEIEYVREVLNGQIAEIDTKTILKDGSEYTGNYKLIFRAGGWRVYDVVVEDVSVVNNYRAEFERFSSKRSFDDLLQVLREKRAG
jgi:phospholipid transport system substrate-binding protein